jgi:hypothetical protein
MSSITGLVAIINHTFGRRINCFPGLYTPDWGAALTRAVADAKRSAITERFEFRPTLGQPTYAARCDILNPPHQTDRVGPSVGIN